MSLVSSEGGIHSRQVHEVHTKPAGALPAAGGSAVALGLSGVLSPSFEQRTEVPARCADGISRMRTDRARSVPARGLDLPFGLTMAHKAHSHFFMELTILAVS